LTLGSAPVHVTKAVVSGKPPKSMQRIQEVMTALLRHKIALSLADVEAALLKWRAGELGPFEAHAELLRHAGRAERMAERMSRVDSESTGALLRDAFDVGLVERGEFGDLVGASPEEVEPSPPMTDDLAEPELPGKRELVDELLAAGPVLVHVDARDRAAQVPERFRDDPRLVLRFGHGLTPSIVDLTVDDEAISGTLTFAGSPFRCVLPWHAVYAVVSEVDQKGMVWPDDVPAPVVEQLTAHAPSQGPAPEGAEDAKPKVTTKGAHLKLVK
jgi:stringent starvation protein B